MSKLLTSPPLYTRTDQWGNCAFANVAWWFCAADFRKYFDVPKTAKKVWLEFHTSPDADRYKAEAMGGPVYCAYLNDEYVPVLCRTVAMIVSQLKTEECYVECYYEE